MSLSGIFAQIVALIGAAALRWRRLQGVAPEPAWGNAPVVPAAPLVPAFPLEPPAPLAPPSSELAHPQSMAAASRT